MFNLTNRDIARRCSNLAIYYRGLEYYLHGAVKKMTYNAASGYLEAAVQGQKLYTVEIYFNEKGEIVDAECDCAAYDNYPGDCKHITAVLLTAARSREKIKPAEEALVEELLEGIGTGTAGDLGKRKLRLETTIKLLLPRYRGGTGRTLVSLKVGEDKTYVVKNIGKFIAAVLREEELYFGKNFSYRPAEHRFSVEDLGIIDFFAQWLEFEQNTAGSTVFYEPLRGKELELSGALLRRLLLRLKGATFNLQLNERFYPQIAITESAPPVSFTLDGSARELLLSMEAEGVLIPLTAEWDFIFCQDRIYQLTGSGAAALRPLLLVFSQKDGAPLRIDRAQMQRFLSEALPSIETAAALAIAPSLQERLHRPPLEVKVFLDYEDGAIAARLDFSYGGIAVNPFTAESPPDAGGRILMRDTARELELLRLFEQAEFKVRGPLLYLEEDEAIWRFIHEILTELQSRAAVYYSDRFKKAGVRRSPRFTGRVGLDQSLNLLELNLELEGIEPEELEQIWLSLREKRKYHRLRDGAILPLEGEGVAQLARVADALDLKPADLRQKAVRLPAAQALFLEQFIHDRGLTGIRLDEAVTALVHLIRSPNEAGHTPPPSLQGILRDYQKTGFRWLKSLAQAGFGGILADDMGLGKTLQAIALILSEREENRGSPLPPALVVAPASLIFNWEAEIQRFAPSLKVLVAAGSKDERQELLSRLEGVDVVITSYPLLRRDSAAYAALNFSCCFFDEAQNIKNPHSQTAQCARRLKAARRFALTGTPIENSLTELWSIFQCIMPGYLPPYRKFMEKYNLPAAPDSSASRDEALAALAAKVRPFVLRRLKEEVLAELPPKIEHRYYSELTREQKKIYLAYLERLRDDTRLTLQEGGYNRERIRILAGLTRLRQICCHPALCVENYRGESAKLLQLQELLRDLVGGGHRLLLFSQFTEMLQLIKNMLEQERYRYLYLDGAVKTGERLQLVERFNEGEGEIFLISLKAGGTGLNLTGADVVIQYDLWWNPAVEQQAADRAHRIGQKKVVQVIRMLARDTIEEKIYALQQQKKELIDRVIKPGESFLSAMSEDDIREILEI